MSRLPALLASGSLLVAGVALSCDEALPPLPDGKVAADSATDAAADSAKTDAANANDDATRPDLLQQRDAPPPDQRPPQPDGPPPVGTVCTSDSDCKVFTDCCTCTAIHVTETRGSCKKTCVINTCQSWGIANPVAYCVGGRCKVAAKQVTPCGGDASCQRIDNCCNCLALPTGLKPPPCGTTCPLSKCPSEGLSKAQPGCLGGICRLSF